MKIGSDCGRVRVCSKWIYLFNLTCNQNNYFFCYTPTTTTSNIYSSSKWTIIYIKNKIIANSFIYTHSYTLFFVFFFTADINIKCLYEYILYIYIYIK
jgi:hypothetical protein